MNDPQTTVLYVLTTLAQSCAALAALVGAVGVFRIQMLREPRHGAEHALRGQTHAASIYRDVVFSMPVEKIAEHLDHTRTTITETTVNKGDLLAAIKALDAWQAFVPLMHNSRAALLVLEA